VFSRTYGSNEREGRMKQMTNQRDTKMLVV